MDPGAPPIVFDQVSLYLEERCFLHQVDLTLHAGETLVVAGQPGCGKSFILRLALGLPGMARGEVVHLEGAVSIFGQSLVELSAAELQKLRTQMGSVLWEGGLIDNMDIRRNITLALYYHFLDVMSIADIEARCTALLADMNLGHLDQPGRRPVSLNREERIYVALARALIHQPLVLLLDDPTMGLSPVAAARMARFLFHQPGFADGIEIHRPDKGKTSRLIATTSMGDFLDCADRFAVIQDQELRIVGDREAVVQSRDPRVRNLLGAEETLL